MFHNTSGPLKDFCKIFRRNVCGWYDLFVITSLDQTLFKYPNYLFSCLYVCIGGGGGGGRFISSLMPST